MLFVNLDLMPVYTKPVVVIAHQLRVAKRSESLKNNLTDGLLIGSGA